MSCSDMAFTCFYNVAVQKRANFGRRLITAEYGDLSLDILPVRNLDEGGWAAEVVKSAKFFRQMLPWQKDVVRILKASEGTSSLGTV